MAKDYKKLATEILQNIGGEENVTSLTHCMTRLRFVLKDEAKVNMEALKKVNGVIQVVVSAGQHQVVIGTDVEKAYDAILSISSIKQNGSVETVSDTTGTESKKGFLSIMIDTISGIFFPFIGAFAAAGLLKGILIVLETLSLIDTSGTTYTLLYSIADGFFYFLPVALAFTAGKKFGANQFVSVAIAFALVYPSITELYSAGAAVSFIGIPVTLISYPTSVIPIVIAVFIQSKLEKALKPVIPQVVSGILTPLISLTSVSLFTFIVIGPVSNWISIYLCRAILFLLNACPPVAGFIFGLIYPLMLIFGLHYGLIPLAMNNMATLGYDVLFPITTGTNFAIAGATLAVFLKTRNRDLKGVSSSCFVSAALGGITEPAIYSILLKYKRPFAIVCLMDGIGGMILATAGAHQTAVLTNSVLTIAPLVAMMGYSAAIAIAIGFVGSAVATYLFGFNDEMLEN